MRKCPRCANETKQHKIGFTQSGSQRYKWEHCSRRYTPVPKAAGYPEALRQRAVRMYLDGLNFRCIGRLLGVHHTSVMHWVNAHAERLGDTSVPDGVETVEMDELYTFVGRKKPTLHESGAAQTYFSAVFEAYPAALYWPAVHHIMDDKRETYSVEGDHAELRHYLARLARRSRCFTRCVHALRRAI
jgi:transposase-like protein/IS1 family transposase